MAYCERCDLDDSMCAHSVAARRLAAANKPGRGRRRARHQGEPAQPTGLRTSNREWDGERLGSVAYLRDKRHKELADRDLDITWNVYACMCPECTEVGRCYLDDDHPAVAGLVEYSLVALTEAMSRLMDLHPDHDFPPTPADWLEMVRQRHAEARTRDLDARDLDALAADSSRSQRPPARWVGRSPGYYSRGR